ncbi:MAG TPA: VOC family protein [Acidimicrobiales bacterium]|nr:VOC family protein [Acidimicrobiales bacterium]
MPTTPDERGPTGPALWSNPAEWAALRTPAGCPICQAGRPRDVLVELATCWVTGGSEAPLPGYVCVVAREHHNEPFEMTADEQARFWQEAMVVAGAVARVVRPVKLNYEIHGNTLPHLHLHVFPRHVDDPFAGGPIDPSRAGCTRTEEELNALAEAIRAEGRPTSSGGDEQVHVRVSAATLSTPDVPRLAAFYEALLGWRRVDDSPGWVRLRSPAGGPGLSFHHDDRFRRPTWPSSRGEQQAHAHLDIATDDVEAAVARAVGLGARVAHHQPQPGVRVLLDPDGRPFCLFAGAAHGEHDLVDWHGVVQDADEG